MNENKRSKKLSLAKQRVSAKSVTCIILLKEKGSRIINIFKKLIINKYNL